MIHDCTCNLSKSVLTEYVLVSSDDESRFLLGIKWSVTML